MIVFSSYPLGGDNKLIEVEQGGYRTSLIPLILISTLNLPLYLFGIVIRFVFNGRKHWVGGFVVEW